LSRAVALSSGGLITIDCLSPEIGLDTRLIADQRDMDERQRRYLQPIPVENRGNRRRTADVLNLDRRTIQRLIARAPDAEEDGETEA
jgi:hypothetical protein